MLTIKQKAQKADGRTVCLGCPLKGYCDALAPDWTIGHKIAKLCSQRFIEGYIKGFKARRIKP